MSQSTIRSLTLFLDPDMDNSLKRYIVHTDNHIHTYIHTLYIHTYIHCTHIHTGARNGEEQTMDAGRSVN